MLRKGKGGKIFEIEQNRIMREHSDIKALGRFFVCAKNLPPLAVSDSLLIVL